MAPSSTMVDFTEPDMYGQSHPSNESPALIQAKLQELESEIAKLDKEQSEALNQAKVKCPKLVNDEDFLLLFLRCEVFNADLAAKRLAKYWTKRVFIFGPEKAFFPLTLAGALQDDWKSGKLELELIRDTGSQDPSGRTILFFDPSKLPPKQPFDRLAILRTIWYVVHAVLRDNVTAQQKGVIFVGYPQNAKFAQFDRQLEKLLIDSLQGCLPVRVSAMHITHPPTFFRIVFPIVKLFLSERLRKRIRVHAGSKEKVLQALEEPFGLKKDVLPSDIGGTKILNHAKWLQERKDSGL